MREMVEQAGRVISRARSSSQSAFLPFALSVIVSVPVCFPATLGENVTGDLARGASRQTRRAVVGLLKHTRIGNHLDQHRDAPNASCCSWDWTP